MCVCVWYFNCMYVVNLISWEELFFILKLWSAYILSVRCVCVF